MKDLDRYVTIIGKPEIDEIKSLGKYLKGRRVHHINSTKSGGGVAEILQRLVPLMESLGIKATWDAIEGNAEFFDVTKMIHNAMHGQEVDFSPEQMEILEQTNRQNEKLLDEPADITIIHDPQPLPLVTFRREKKRPIWLWRCHIDLSEADYRVWGALRHYVEQFDGSLFHLPEYSKGLGIPQYILPPAIDPLSEKNMELTLEEVQTTVDNFGIDPEKPYIIQVSRFDRLKDPVGVIEAFRMVQEWHDVQLVLAGGSASDDPEGVKVLQEVREAADNDPDIHILDLPPTSHIEINALQRGARIIIQKSLREGFGLVVTEAMWKGKPVIGGAVGGIKTQVIHNVTGFLASTIEGTAYRIRQLLANPGLSDRLGHAAKEYIRSNFLLPSYLKNWLLLLLQQEHMGERITFLD
ncbi:glycosyl transferase family 1 [candidate division LCP-89 bacterium B3_LCP]|uniref:Glycosyl transferase family 1 n=1 Tax=candidate division LCP-89 bacterium B3_LCP TaxID=2012998 RepID=A0A532UVX9_UNCL8|nr:MAG: glycosyl transferase family 1 [candidate division LCP-89 bacterium B3_LCP]